MKRNLLMAALLSCLLALLFPGQIFSKTKNAVNISLQETTKGKTLLKASIKSRIIDSVDGLKVFVSLNGVINEATITEANLPLKQGKAKDFEGRLVVKFDANKEFLKISFLKSGLDLTLPHNISIEVLQYGWWPLVSVDQTLDGFTSTACTCPQELPACLKAATIPPKVIACFTSLKTCCANCATDCVDSCSAAKELALTQWCDVIKPNLVSYCKAQANALDCAPACSPPPDNDF